MHITLTNKGQRHQLTCTRADGSMVRADLGPSLPYHDLAHYVGEQTLGLNLGFFGQIAAGRTPAGLADPEVIRALGPESWQAEVLARGIGSMATGACLPDQLAELVNSELRLMGIGLVPGLEPLAEALKAAFERWADAYQALEEGESLQLHFDPA